MKSPFLFHSLYSLDFFVACGFFLTSLRYVSRPVSHVLLKLQTAQLLKITKEESTSVNKLNSRVVVDFAHQASKLPVVLQHFELI